jgi:hypothetical protein
MKKIAFSLIVSAIFLFSASGILAKSCRKCAVSSVKQALMVSAAVFSGKVLKVSQSGNTKIIEFQAEKYWKGTRKKRLKISVDESTRFESFFESGGRYLVYSFKSEDGKLQVGRCSRSTEIENAKDDIKQLGNGKKPK